MYNRYIPSADGTYRRESISGVAQSEQSIETTAESFSKEARPLLSLPTIDNNDLLILAILFLVLQNSEGQERLSILITLAAFLLLN